MKRTVKIGAVTIGGNHQVVLQSMTNTKTRDIEKTVKQINELANGGAQIVRLAIENKEDALAIKTIKTLVNVALVADIHFDYRLALLAVEAGIDKLRINPGNISDKSKIKLIVEACEKANIPIRIGVNGGSLDKRIRQDNEKLTAQMLIESAKQEIAYFESLNFTNIVLSLKCSDPLICLEAYRMADQLWDYPLHVGLTEAGDLTSGTVRSSFVVGTLINEGIGNTVRISLTADPVEELPVAREILKIFGLIDEPTIISCPTCGRTNYDMPALLAKVTPFIKQINKKIKIAIMGCVVNGPGEAKDADLAIAGGCGYIAIFKKGELLKKVTDDQLFDSLIEEINKL